MRVIWMCFILILVIACSPAKEESDSGAGEAKSKISVSASDVPATQMVRWTVSDIVAFDTHVSTIEPNKLPIYSETDTNSQFNIYVRSIRQDNFSDDQLELKVRLDSASSIQNALKNTLSKYYAAMLAGEEYGLEVSYLFGSILVNANDFYPLFKAYLTPANPNDPIYSDNVTALKQAELGVAQILYGAVVSLAETNVYNDSHREVLAKYISEEAPAIIEFLSRDMAREILSKINDIKTNESNERVRSYLEKVIA